MMDFWRKGLSDHEWKNFFVWIVSTGQSGYRQVKEGTLDFGGRPQPPWFFAPVEAQSALIEKERKPSKDKK